MALDRSPDVAIDYSAEAVAMHRANHPSTTHICTSVWDVSAKEVVGRRRVDLLWASPDCTHFSRAKGGKPRETGRRSLAHVVIEWMRDVRPAVVCLENVAEFVGWGPLLADGSPCKRRKGESFRAWVAQMDWLGYSVEWRTLVAADYGAPTSRQRLFVVARCDGEPIVWPEPTHGPGRAKPWRTAAEIIDWSIPAPSIFERKKPLAPKTLARIKRGIERYVIGAPNPFVCAPLETVVSGGAKHALVAAYLCRHYGGRGSYGRDLREPVPTVTTIDHNALVTVSPEGSHRDQVRGLLGSDARITLGGEDYEIADIGMRMLTQRELFAAQGFPADYDLLDGHLSKTTQIRLCGNSVCPPVAAAVVAANAAKKKEQA